MATVTSWVEALNAGETVIYPFVGTEWLWLIIAIAFWIVWHVRSSASETEENDELASKGKSSDDYKSNIANW
ncbi:hypothetical protein OAU87_05610 [Alphaproteobacteria bacterium]|nr:hypothetical protein [Alphaproteobacteria bacterium]MDC3270691.1 hypothetical protein [Alphaproteobacteria bacterium]